MDCRLLSLTSLWGVLTFFSCTLTIDEEALRSSDPHCFAEEKFCEERGEPLCVSANDPDFGCARASCTPCNLKAATPTCDPNSGECVIASCIGDFEDCDGDDENGCEVDLNTDSNHCGSCNSFCPEVEHAQVRCGGARCYIRVCSAGFMDCNEKHEDGCEVDTRSNQSHCGACQQECSGQCIEGVCQHS